MRAVVERSPKGDVIAVRCTKCEDVVPFDEVTKRVVNGRHVYFCTTCPTRFRLVCKAIALDPEDACGGPAEISAEEIAYGVWSHGDSHGWRVRQRGKEITAHVTAVQWAWLTDPGTPCAQCEVDQADSRYYGHV